MGGDEQTKAPGRSLRILFAKILEETNFIVTSLTACCVMYTRSAGVAYFAAGAVACSLSVKAIKRVIRHPRPVRLKSKKKTYGMPSTHSAAITFFATYIPLACTYLPIHPSLPSSKWTRLLPPAIVTPWAISIVYSRIWFGHHTWPQCIVGCMCGAAFAFAWFGLWANGANEYGQVIETQVNTLLFHGIS